MPASVTAAARLRGISAGPKPWPDREGAPFEGDGDTDGQDYHRTFPDEPGDHPDRKPTGEPEIRARAALNYAAATVGQKDPDAFNALLGIEARLLEIIPLLPAAMRGADAVALLKLRALSRFI
jgi:hypothetical protein